MGATESGGQISAAAGEPCRRGVPYGLWASQGVAYDGEKISFAAVALGDVRKWRQ